MLPLPAFFPHNQCFPSSSKRSITSLLLLLIQYKIYLYITWETMFFSTILIEKLCFQLPEVGRKFCREEVTREQKQETGTAWYLLQYPVDLSFWISSGYLLFVSSRSSLASSVTVGSIPLEMRLRTTRAWLNFPTNYSQPPTTPGDNQTNLRGVPVAVVGHWTLTVCLLLEVEIVLILVTVAVDAP